MNIGGINSMNEIVLSGESEHQIQQKNGDIISSAIALSDSERNEISIALNNGLYKMAAEYIWTRTISNLKKCIMQFGDDFVLEMLGKQLPPYSSIDDILNEIETINLSKELGLIDETEHLFLSQQSQMLQYFINNKNAVAPSTAYKSCVEYCVSCVLEKEISFNSDFTNFREKLYTQNIAEDISQLVIIKESDYFYIKTVCRTLINLIKTKQSGELDYTLNNFQMILPQIWSKLLSDDKYLIGTLYSQMVNDGNAKISGTVKSLLSKVRGFDYVPESLRSNTFIMAAAEFKKVHYAMNNFYNEPAAIRNLYNLGTIPAPALCECISAALLCKIGNPYGVSDDAQENADKILDSILPNKWDYYLSNKLPVDNDILLGLYHNKPFNEWKVVVNKYNFASLTINNARVNKIVKFTISGNHKGVLTEADKLRAGQIS
jgi:hypothetical protein